MVSKPQAPGGANRNATRAPALLSAFRVVRRRLAGNVLQRRLALGLTQEELAERAAMHWRLWQKIEAGQVNATLITLARLARALRVDVRELFDVQP